MTSYTLQVQPRRQYTIQYSNERGPQGATGATGLGFEPIPTARLLGNNTGSTALPTALQPNNVRNLLEIISQAETQAIVDGKLSLTGGTLTGKLAFSGATHSGLCLNSLTTAQYNALTAINGDLFRDSTTDRIDARLARGTVELLDTAGGQTINGALTASGTVTNQGIRLLQAAGGSLRGVLNCPSWDISYVALRNGTLAETAANTGFYQSSQGDSALNAASGRGASISIANVSVVGVTSGAVAITGTLSYTGSLVFPELVTNGDFSVGTGWAMGVGWSISGGVAVATGVVSFRDIQQNLPAVELGRTYIISFSVSLTSGSVQVFLGSSGSGPGAVTTINGSGTYSFLHHKSPADTIRTILFRGGAAFTGTIDNVSVKRAF